MAASEYEQWVQWLMRLLAFIQYIMPGEWPTPYQIKYGDKFDYIVVGAGSAGAIVASRLSEDPQNQVLLVEAGGDPSFFNVVPSLFTMLWHSEYDWDYTSFFDNDTAKAHPNGTVPQPRGKGLGGSSSMNFMAYVRGFPADYDKWNYLPPGWDWNSTLPYFKKLEGYMDPQIMRDPKHANLHGTSGPVLITRPKLDFYFQEKIDNILDAFEEIGVKRILEINGGDTCGATQPHTNIAYGRRSSTAEAYLKPAKNRPNLHVATYTRATKVLIDSDTREAYGIEVILKSGEKVKVFAKKEVIVSAGTIESPKLLMLSGVGPEQELNKFGIKVIADLPVGRNFNDHILVNVVLQGEPGKDCEAFNRYALQEFHAYPFPMSVGYFSVTNKAPSRPEFQFFTMHSCANASNIPLVCKSGANFDDALCESVHKANLDRELVVVFVVLLHPSSVGGVSLKTKNPLDDPVIEIGMFRDKYDLYKLTEGVKYVARLENTRFFKQVGGQIARLNVPGCEGLEFGSDEHWECYVRNTASSFVHAVGTCAMGSVVDERLRVRGIKGLRVADASVMHATPSANTNAAVMMIGERVSDLIKEDDLETCDSE